MLRFAHLLEAEPIMQHWKSLIVFFVLVALAAASGAIALPDAWYVALTKPSFNPPNWVFPPAWTALYIIMAIAAWRVYRITGLGRDIGFWVAQLILNAAWSPLFFGLHRITWAMIDIVLLLALIVTTTVLFWRRDRIAGVLMLPYLAWVSFATLLTASIWHLNVA
jgi:translocator protein